MFYGKKISIKGSQFDASNLPKILNQKKNKNTLPKISKDIEIDFSNIIVPLSENLKNFKLIGKIKKGKFIKIISKGDFGNNNYLDISMKNDNKNKNSRRILKLIENPKKLLATILIGNNLVNVAVVVISSIVVKNILPKGPSSISSSPSCNVESTCSV